MEVVAQLYLRCVTMGCHYRIFKKIREYIIEQLHPQRVYIHLRSTKRKFFIPWIQTASCLKGYFLLELGLAASLADSRSVPRIFIQQLRHFTPYCLMYQNAPLTRSKGARIYSDGHARDNRQLSFLLYQARPLRASRWVAGPKLLDSRIPNELVRLA